jgi:hypothetical protein
MQVAERLRYVKKDDLFMGFSDKQIEELFRNMTIFMYMDGCPSPCDICIFDANKSPKAAMDADFIEELFTTFSDNFDKNKPPEHANDDIAYVGRRGETFEYILELYKKHLHYYPSVETAFPRGAENVLWKILNMGFVSGKHPHDDKHAQLVIPGISKHPANEKIVEDFLTNLEASSNFVGKDEKKRKSYEVPSWIYRVHTDHGVRELDVDGIRILPINSASKYASLYEGKGLGPIYLTCMRPGVAVTPSGFYNYNGLDFTYPQLMKRRISPDNFQIQERRDTTLAIIYCSGTGNTVRAPISTETASVLISNGL